MGWYRNRIVEFEAVQLRAAENPKDVCDFVQRSSPGAASYDPRGRVFIQTAAGTVCADDGDWIIRSSDGDFRVCGYAAFADTCEPV